MFKKMFPWLIVILIAITLVGLAAFILLNFLDKQSAPSDPKEQALTSAERAKVEPHTAAELKDLTLEMNDVLTNLSDRKSVVKISFTFEFDNKKAKDEFGLLDFKVKDAVIQTLSQMTGDEIHSTKGRDQLTATLINKINAFLTKGKLAHIYVTNYILTEQ